MIENLTTLRLLQAQITRLQASGLSATGGLTAQVDVLSAIGTALAEGTATPAWRLVEWLPGTARPARAVTATAGSLAALTTAGRPLAVLLDAEPTTRGKALALLAAPAEVAALQAATEAARVRLAPYADLQLPGLPDSAARAVGGLTAASDGLSELVRAGPPLQGMAGLTGPRRWLVMSQNPAESRGTGGLFNAYLIVEVTNGELRVVESGSRKLLDAEFPREEQIPYFETVDVELAHTWGPVLGEWASFNLPGDFPTVAALAAAGMAKRGTPVDGVIALDPYVVAALLAGTGAVEHRGVRIDGASAADFFTRGLYEDFPEIATVSAKDELAMGLTYATIEAVLARPLDLAAMWSPARSAVTEGRLRVWSENRQEQAWLETTPLAGSFASRPGEVIVTFNNASGGKLDTYARREVRSDVSACKEGRVSTEVLLANEAPGNLPDYVDLTLGPDGLPDPTAPRGQTITYITAYPPAGWSFDSARIDDEPVPGWEVREAGRIARTVPVTLQRGQRTMVSFHWQADRCPATLS